MVKCPICRGCLDRVWVHSHMYFHCELCRKHYRRVAKKLIEVDPQTYNAPYDDEKHL